MKKTLTKVLTTVLACGLMFTAAACGGKNNDNAGKTAIKTSFFIGEFGDEWIKDLAKEWSAKNDKYYIDVKNNLNLGGTIVADIKSNSSFDLFVAEDCAMQQLFAGDYLEDLSDVLSLKPDGGKTIKEKIENFDHWSEAASLNGKTYMIPYNISPCGLIFDYDRFNENGWLMTDGAGNVTVGKDGVAGTYDDGLPQTMTEFKSMCEKINASGAKVFLYMGANHPEYVNNVAYSYLAQTIGEENYEIFYSHDSKGKKIELISGEKAVVTIEDGYKTWRMKGVDAMAEFLQDYLCNSSRYVSDATLTDKSLSVDKSHAQFISVNDDSPAFIVEGNWFENGSRRLIESNVNYGGKEYGKSDYRYMLLPISEGERYQLFSQTGGAMFVPKQADAEKLAAIKDFIAFMIKDENMARVTADTGMIWNYKYSVSEEVKAQMTKFTKNAYEMSQDEKNVVIHSAYIDTAATPIYAYSALGASGLMMCSDSQYDLVRGFLDKGNASAFVAGIAQYNDAARWAGYLSQAKTYGFYN